MAVSELVAVLSGFVASNSPAGTTTMTPLQRVVGDAVKFTLVLAAFPSPINQPMNIFVSPLALPLLTQFSTTVTVSPFGIDGTVSVCEPASRLTG